MGIVKSYVEINFCLPTEKEQFQWVKIWFWLKSQRFLKDSESLTHEENEIYDKCMTEIDSIIAQKPQIINVQAQSLKEEKEFQTKPIVETVEVKWNENVVDTENTSSIQKILKQILAVPSKELEQELNSLIQEDKDRYNSKVWTMQENIISAVEELTIEVQKAIEYKTDNTKNYLGFCSVNYELNEQNRILEQKIAEKLKNLVSILGGHSVVPDVTWEENIKWSNNTEAFQNFTLKEDYSTSNTGLIMREASFNDESIMDDEKPFNTNVLPTKEIQDETKVSWFFWNDDDEIINKEWQWPPSALIDTFIPEIKPDWLKETNLTDCIKEYPSIGEPQAQSMPMPHESSVKSLFATDNPFWNFSSSFFDETRWSDKKWNLEDKQQSPSSNPTPASQVQSSQKQPDESKKIVFEY